MASYDLYGCIADGIEAASLMLGSALNLSFDERESSYHCGKYYLWGQTSGEHFLLKRNRDPYEDEMVESKFGDYQLLLYVNDTLRGSEIRSQLASLGSLVILLRAENI